MRRVVISLYDYTTLALNSWALHGYETHAFDIMHEKEVKNEHGTHLHPWNADDHDAIEQVIRYAGDRTLILGWPPCTDLTKVGNAHWKAKFEADPDFQMKALRKVLLVKDIAERINAPYMFENPVGRVSTLYKSLITGSTHVITVVICLKTMCIPCFRNIMSHVMRITSTHAYG